MHVQVYLDFLHMKIFYFVEDVILFFLYIVQAWASNGMEEHKF